MQLEETLGLARTWTSFKQDFRYGLRLLAANPGFSAVAILSLALGIGSTTAIFSVVYAVLLDPFPYRAPQRIGQIVLTDLNGQERKLDYTKSQYLEVARRAHPLEVQTPRIRPAKADRNSPEDTLARQTACLSCASSSEAIEDAVAYSRDEVTMRSESFAEIVSQDRCSANFFDFLGVAPLFGRTFSSRASGQNAPPDPVVVLSYQFWQRVFLGQKDVLGKQLRFDDGLYTVIGVMPVRFTWTDDADVYIPLDMRAGKLEFVSLFYRKRPSVSDAQVTGELAPLLEEFRKQVPLYRYPDGPLKLKFQTLNDGILGKFANTLLALFGAVTLLLLIACGNVANLLLARAAVRQGEIAVRTALGASRIRLFSQLLTESILLALLGGTLGVFLAFGEIHAVVALMPRYSIPHEAVISLNWPVLRFALAVSMLTALIFGTAPAVQISGETHNQALRGAAKASGVSKKRRRWLDALIATEIALSLLLLTGAGLAVEGFLSLKRKALGYDPRNTITFVLPLSEGRYTTWTSRTTLFRQLEQRLRQLPNAEAVSIATTGLPPWTGGVSKISVDGSPARALPEVSISLTSDGYFSTIRTPVLQGRQFSEDEVARGSAVAVITQALALAVFPPTQSPLGHHLEISLFKESLPPEYLTPPHLSQSFLIVGVVADARNGGPSQQPMPAVSVPFTTFCSPVAWVLVRTRTSPPQAILNDARAVVRAVDPSQPITQVCTLEEWLSNATAYPKFTTFLFGVFGAVGMLLATCGVFSVVSYAVAHRIREFGLRVALGATAPDVLRLVLSGVGRMLAVGLATGVGLSAVASKLLANQMKGMGDGGWPVFTLAALLLALATGLACLWPARQALAVQPMEALRHE